MSRLRVAGLMIFAVPVAYLLGAGLVEILSPLWLPEGIRLPEERRYLALALALGGSLGLGAAWVYAREGSARLWRVLLLVPSFFFAFAWDSIVHYGPPASLLPFLGALLSLVGLGLAQPKATSPPPA